MGGGEEEMEEEGEGEGEAEVPAVSGLSLVPRLCSGMSVWGGGEERGGSGRVGIRLQLHIL